MSAPSPKKFRLNMFLPLLSLAIIAVFLTYEVRNNYKAHKNEATENHPDKARHALEGGHHESGEHEKADSSHK